MKLKGETVQAALRHHEKQLLLSKPKCKYCDNIATRIEDYETLMCQECYDDIMLDI